MRMRRKKACFCNDMRGGCQPGPAQRDAERMRIVLCKNTGSRRGSYTLHTQLERTKKSRTIGKVNERLLPFLPFFIGQKWPGCAAGDPIYTSNHHTTDTRSHFAGHWSDKELQPGTVWGGHRKGRVSLRGILFVRHDSIPPWGLILTTLIWSYDERKQRREGERIAPETAPIGDGRSEKQERKSQAGLEEGGRVKCGGGRKEMEEFGKLGRKSGVRMRLSRTQVWTVLWFYILEKNLLQARLRFFLVRHLNNLTFLSCL